MPAAAMARHAAPGRGSAGVRAAAARRRAAAARRAAPPQADRAARRGIGERRDFTFAPFLRRRCLMLVAEAEAPVLDPLDFTATDVTGSNFMEFRSIDGYRFTEDVASSVAEAMELPTNVPWALRDDESARMLQDDRPIGSQIRPKAKLIVIPKSHLGGDRR